MFVPEKKRKGVTAEPVTLNKVAIPMSKPPSGASPTASAGPRLRVDMGLANSQGKLQNITYWLEETHESTFAALGAAWRDINGCAF